MSAREKLSKTARRVRDANRKADPVVDSVMTRIGDGVASVWNRVKASPYSGPIVAFAIVVVGAFVLWWTR